MIPDPQDIPPATVTERLSEALTNLEGVCFDLIEENRRLWRELQGQHRPAIHLQSRADALLEAIRMCEGAAAVVEDHSARESLLWVARHLDAKLANCFPRPKPKMAPRVQ